MFELFAYLSIEKLFNTAMLIMIFLYSIIYLDDKGQEFRGSFYFIVFLSSISFLGLGLAKVWI